MLTNAGKARREGNQFFDRNRHYGKNVADPLEMDKTVSLESCCKYFTKFSTCNNISSELSMYGELGKRIKIKGSVI